VTSWLSFAKSSRSTHLPARIGGRIVVMRASSWASSSSIRLMDGLSCWLHVIRDELTGVLD
jgi:hypothetical protein